VSAVILIIATILGKLPYGWQKKSILRKKCQTRWKFIFQTKNTILQGKI
jgi:hypothetical protein